MNDEVDIQRSKIDRKILLWAGLLMAVISGIAVAMDLPELIPLVVFPCLGWWAWRAFRISGLGIILLVVTMELVTGYASSVYRCSFYVGLGWFVVLSFPTVVCMFGSILAFLVKAQVLGEQRRRNLLAIAGACVLPIVWFVVGGRGAGMLAEWQLQREIARCGVSEFIAELNAVTERLGRAPKDEKEVVELLGKPLPVVPGHRVARYYVRYQAVGGKRFFLTFGDALDGKVYDSEKPDRGWYWGEVPSAPDDQGLDDGRTHAGE